MCSINDANERSKFQNVEQSNLEQSPVFESREETAGAVSVKQVSLHKEQGAKSGLHDEPAKGSAHWFNDRFDEHLFALYSVSEHRLDRVEWELSKVVPQLLAALPLPEWVKDPDHRTGSASASHEEGDSIPGMVPVELIPLVDKFTRLSLTAARCRCIMEDLRPLYFDLRGDSVLDWTDAAVRADYGRRFTEWLQYDEHARDAWEHCRLTVEDLINDMFIFEEEGNNGELTGSGVAVVD